MDPLRDERRKPFTTPLVVAIFLLVVGMGVFWGAFRIARSGALDFLLATQTLPATSPPAPQPSDEPTRQAFASHTPLAMTATPQAAATLTALPPTATLAPSSTPTESVTVTSTPTQTPTASSAGAYRVEYEGCISHGSGIGTVKGVVFDRQGQVIPGAEVRITLDGYPYDKPAISNGAGWYEFYLNTGLKIRIASLRINGQEVPLLGQDQEFKSQGGCFEHVNLRQQ